MTEINSIYWKEPCDPNKYSLDDVCDMLKSKLVKYKDSEIKIMVGTDSHGVKNEYHFVTVVGFWALKKGGTYYHNSTFEPKTLYRGTEKLKLQAEVFKSLEVATKIEEKLNIKPEIHLDISSVEKQNYSSSVCEMLKNYVISSGFNPIIKPDSFMANYIADKHTRKKKNKYLEQ